MREIFTESQDTDSVNNIADDFKNDIQDMPHISIP